MPRPKYSSDYYRRKFERLSTKQRWPGHPDWNYMTQGVISIRMRQAVAQEENARWYQDRDKKNLNVVSTTGGPAIRVADLKTNIVDTTTTTTTPNTSWADIQ